MNYKFASENVYVQLQNRERKIAVVGLGYVGLPLAVSLAKKFDVIGMDTNCEKIEKYKKGIDITGEVSDEVLRQSGVRFTSCESDIKEAALIIVAVPTPIHRDKTPDLEPVINASRLVGRNLTKGTVVCFESTVYPGVTEDFCAPEMEKESGFAAGIDFFVGYSPERVNPGDKLHTVETITKIVSAAQPEVRQFLAAVYGSIVTGGIHEAESIRVAEAAKLLENSQRDVNIAFMNEMAMGLHHMGINTADVIRAMDTKWNSLGFKPGLVGGHCIGVDPYYFVYEAERLGYHSSIISAARRINDDLPEVVANEIIKELVLAKCNVAECSIYMLGMTFKGNCPDLRNTKLAVVKKEIEKYGLTVQISDTAADPYELEQMFQQKPVLLQEISQADCLIFAADHSQYCELTANDLSHMMKPDGAKLVVDIRSIYRRTEIENAGLRYWSL